MGLKLHIIHASEFTQMSREGEVDLAASKQAMAELAKAANGVANSQFLIDTRRAIRRLSTLDMVELADGLEKYEVFVGKKIAPLVSGTRQKVQAEFFKLCANNRGYLVNVFCDYEAAINWLFLRTELSPEMSKSQGV